MKLFYTLLLAILFVIPSTTHAGVSDNVSGFAWSENIGWVSFNCTDLGSCGSVDYGVNMRGDSFLEGYAWSDNIGWISFNHSETGAPPGDYDYSGSGFIAQLDTATNELRGWARALAGMDDPLDGWDGWIKLFKHPSDSGADYGVTYNDVTGEFENWAWGSDVVGWLSFNCNNDHGAGPVCGSSDYKVIANINFPPTASDLIVVANYSDSNNVCLSPPDHTFSWAFSDAADGGIQTSYDLEVDNNSDFLSPEVAVSGSASTERSIVVSVASVSGQLNYNQTYNWRIRVHDSGGLDSGWIYPPSPPASPDTIGPGVSFSTAPHLYPTSDFTFVPSAPSQGEEITFNETTTCFDASNNPISCPDNYSWDFDYAPPFEEDATGQSPTHTYGDTASHTVALDVADLDGQICRGTSDVTPRSSLPKFKETAPTSLFERILNTFTATLISFVKTII